MISLVCGTLMVARLGWSLALGCSPVVVLRLLRYFWGLFFLNGVDKFFFCFANYGGFFFFFAKGGYVF